MPSNTTTQPKQSGPISKRAALYLLNTHRRSRHRQLSEWDIVNGAIVSLDSVGVDLTGCRDQADVIDAVSALLKAGCQAISEQEERGT